VTATPVASNGSDPFGVAYEALRRGVLAGASFGGHVGVVLLLREGLAAWMTRGAACAAPVEPERRVVARIMCNETEAAMVTVLANMALGGLEEVRA